MGQTGRTLVFEDFLSKELYQKHWNREVSTDFESFLKTLPQFSSEELELGEKVGRTFCTEPGAEPFLLTVNALRRAGVVAPHHVEYIFSLLPESPKNEALKNGFFSYLESPMSYDLIHVGWKVHDAVKGTIPESKFLFIRGAKPSYLFDEVAKAHASTPTEFWELEPKATKTKPLIIEGPPSRCLLEISQWKGIILFGGSHAELRMLEIFLARTEAEVEILPVQPVPSSLKADLFVDDSFWQPERPETLFTEREWDILHREGFPISRGRREIERKKEIIKSLISEGVVFRLYQPSSSPHLQVEGPSFHLPRLSCSQTTDIEQLPLPAIALSATQLETFATCPTKYLFQNRLRLKPPLDFYNQYPLLFGQAVHEALEFFFRDTPRAPLSGLTPLFENAIAKLLPSEPKESPFSSLLMENFAKIVSRVEDLEKGLREIIGESHPRYFEKEFNCTVDGISFRGKIDRIDELSDGNLLILDYKTGRVDFTPNHIRDGYHFQALLYCLALETEKQPWQGILFYDLKEGELRRGFMKAEGLTPEKKKLLTRGHALPTEEIEDILGAGMDHIRGIVARIKAGDFSPNATAENCSRCDFSGHCRSASGFL